MNGVDLPTPPLGVDRPNLRLIGIAARLFALDGKREPTGRESFDCSVNLENRFYVETIVRVGPELNGVTKIEGKF